MVKLLILGFLALVISVPAIASYLLPWWGTLLVVVGEVYLLRLSVPALLKYGVSKFAKGLFEIKSKVLRNAVVEVHTCEETTNPRREELSESRGDRSATSLGDAGARDKAGRCVLVDCTITPNPKYAGPMTHWDPWDFALAPFGRQMGMRHMDNDTEASEGSLVSVVLLGPDGRDQEHEFDKVSGPMRLRFIFECPATLRGRAKLRYYFEGIGDMQLP